MANSTDTVDTTSGTQDGKTKKSRAGFLLVLFLLVLAGAGLWQAQRYDSLHKLASPSVSPPTSLLSATPAAPSSEPAVVPFAPAEIVPTIEAPSSLSPTPPAEMPLATETAAPSETSEPPAPVLATTTDAQTEVRLQALQMLWNLKTKADGGEAFRNELDALRETSLPLASEDATIRHDLDTLASFAKDGIPTAFALYADFERLIPDILHAAQPLPPETKLWDRALHWLSQQVTIRRIDGTNTSGTDADAAITAIEKALQQQDIVSAANTAQSLSAAGHDAVNPWLSAAQSAVEARQAIASLRAHIGRENAP